MTPAVTISRELAERLIAASKVCTGQDCPPFHHDLALAGDELRAALDAPASSGWRPIESAPIREDVREAPNRCLVWSKRAGVQMGQANIISGEPYANGDGFNGEWGFTHWQPLPPPPGDDIRTTDAITDSERIELRRLGSKWLAEADHANQQEGIARSQGHSEKCAVFSRQAAVYRTCALQLDAAIKQEKG